jgi:diguanylate cyclase (GGDEF)-like protein
MRTSSFEQLLTRPLRFLRINSLRDRMLVFAVLAAGLPSFVTAWVSYTQNKSAVTERLSRQLENVAAQAAREVELWRKDGAYALKVFTSSYEVSENFERAPRPARLTNYLTSLRDRIPDFAVLSVVGLQGHVVASSPAAAPAPPLPKDWLSEIRADRTVVGEPYWDAKLQAPVVTQVVPVRSGSRLLGALAATAQLHGLRQTLRGLAPAGGGRVLLLDPIGRVIVGPDSVTSDSLRVRLAARAQRAGIREYTSVDDVPVVGSFTPITSLRWSVAAELPLSAAYQQLSRLRTMSILIVAALVIGVGLIAYLLGLLLVRPLDRLKEASDQVARGDLDVVLPVLGGGEVGALTKVFNHMVVKLREKSDELERLSTIDGLTGLFNRRHMTALLAAEQRRCQRLKHPFAVVMMDVDHFKSYNDEFGHPAGDKVLAKVSELLQESVREVDSVGRYGGEEFLVLMPESGEAEAAALAERVRRRIAEAKLPHRRVTVSLGVAQYPMHGESVDAVIAAADAALYVAKGEGRNRVSRAGTRPSRTAKSSPKA